jgi:carboxypeptidase T
MTNTHEPAGRRRITWLSRSLGMLLILALLTSHAAAAQDWQDSATLIRVDAPTPDARTTLARMGLDVVGADLSSLTVRASRAQRIAISEAGFAWQEIGGVQAAGAVDPAYHTYQQVVDELQQTASSYPDITCLSIIDYSIEGRPIYAMKISDNPALDEEEPGVLLFALTHAREHLTTEMALYIIQFLTGEYGGDGAITNLVNQREIWVLPNVNPDGDVYDVSAGYYRSWRKNRRPNADGSVGVDLNRNYAYGWGCCGGSSGRPGDYTYRGTAPFSEPESAAIRDFVLAHPNITASISFHTYSELILWPYGYTYAATPADMKPLDYQAFATIGQAMADRNGYIAAQASQLYITDGGSDDWLYGDQGIFAFTYEMYPTSYSPGFYPPGDIIERETTRNRSAIEYFLGIADSPLKVVDEGQGDVTPPTVTLDEPAAGAYIAGALRVSASANDDVEVTLVEFILNGQTVAIDMAAPYELEWDGEPTVGAATIQARAFDAAHNAGQSEFVTIHRSGIAPIRLPLLMRAGMQP